jgi:DnaJ-domain-containing protein 1
MGAGGRSGAWDDMNSQGRRAAGDAGQQGGRTGDNFANAGRASQHAPTDFDVLGLGPDATFQDVRKQHRRMAMKHHPDRGGDAAKFREIQTAYENLRALLVP